MADNIWAALAADNWSTAAAWSLGHIPASDEVAVFDATSTFNCTLDADTGTIGGLDMQTGYGSGTLRFESYTVVVSGDVTVSNTSGQVLGGTGTLDLIETGSVANPHISNKFYNLKVAALTKTTTLAAYVNCQKMVIGGGVLTGATERVVITDTIPSVKTLTVDTGATIAISRFVIDTPASGISEIDGFNSGVSIRINCKNPGTIQLATRSLDLHTSSLEIQGNGTPDGIVDFNDFNVTAGNLRMWGSGASAATIQCGSGVITIATWVEINDGGGGTPTLDLENCTMHIGNFLAVTSGGNIMPGASAVYFDGTSGTIDIQLADESLYDVVFDGAAAIYELQDAFICHDLTIMSGTLKLDDGASAFDVTCNKLTCSGGLLDVSFSSGAEGSGSEVIVSDDFVIADIADLIDFGAGSHVILAGSGDLTNAHVSNTLPEVSHSSGITTEITTDLIIDGTWNLDGCTVLSPSIFANATIALNGNLTIVNNPTWGGNGANELIICWQNALGFPSDNYGDCGITIKKTGVTVGLLGDVETAGDMLISSIVDTNVSDITCRNLHIEENISDDDGKLITGTSFGATGDLTVDSECRIEQVSSGFAVGGDIDFAGFYDHDNEGTIVLNGVGSQDIRMVSMRRILVTNTTGIITFSTKIYDGGAPGSGLSLQPNCYIKFATGVTHELLSWDIDGTSSNVVTLESVSPGVQATIDVATNVTTTYTSFKDINLIGSIVNAISGTNVDAGNNNDYPPGPDGIQWYALSKEIQLAGQLAGQFSGQL